MDRRPLPRSGGGGRGEGRCAAAPYKRRRVERNLHLSRADPSLCFGQPSPLRCVLLSPAGLASRRGPQFSGKPLLWLSGRGGSDASGSWGAAPSVFWFLLYAQKERHGGEPYGPLPLGDSATPLGDYRLVPKFFADFYPKKSWPAGRREEGLIKGVAGAGARDCDGPRTAPPPAGGT